MAQYEIGKIPAVSPEDMAVMLAHCNEEPDTTDMPEWTDEQWAQATRPYLEAVRFDMDVLKWLRTHQNGYANSILREAMQAERAKKARQPVHQT